MRSEASRRGQGAGGTRWLRRGNARRNGQWSQPAGVSYPVGAVSSSPENSGSPESDGSPEASSSLGAQYDRYLDAALRGDEAALAQFVADAPWLRALHELAGRPGATTVPREGEPPTPLLADVDLPFARLGDFRLIRRLGEGGMGIVFLAEQESLRRLVALKIIRPELAASATAAARFTREAQAVARLRHPHIVAVHAFGEIDGVLFFTMDLLPGQNLDAMVRREVLEHGRLPAVRRVLRWGAQLADALDCAHRAGVVHRDVKPSNVRIVDDDTALLLDFGLARELDAGAATVTRAFAGSPSYAAPEQIAPRGGAADVRTDVYGLGATLYEALTGVPPFAADSVERLLVRVLTEEPVPPRRLRPDLPRDVEVIVLRALEKDPARRYPSAQAFAADLRAVVELRPIQARGAGQWTRLVRVGRRHPALVSATVVTMGGLLVMAGLAVMRAQRDQASAAELLREAHGRLDAHDGSRARTVRAQFKLAQLERAENTRSLNAGERGALDSLRSDRDRHRRERELTFAGVQEALAQARRLDPHAVGLDDAWAHFYFARWLELRAGEDIAAAELYRKLTLEHDRSGAWRAKIAGSSGLTIRSDPPGAEVYLFQCARLCDVPDAAREDAEPRVVPMRAGGGDDGLPPGRLVLRVLEARGELRAGDLIFELDGRAVDATAAAADASRARAGRVWRDGGELAVAVPAGAVVRATAAPLVVADARRIGRTPLVDHALDPAWFVLLLRLPGHEDLRVPFHVDHTVEHWFQCAKLEVDLWPQGTTPPGFVRIAAEAYAGDETPCLMAEREVTVGEWADFIADPATRARIDEGGAGGLVPSVGGWVRGGDGAFTPGVAVPRDAPVSGVSWHAAHAYVAWRNAQGTPLPGHVFALPTFTQWERAAKGGDSRRYVFGPDFRAAWVSADASGPRVLARPIDESPWGVFDLAGCASEWCADAAETDPGLRALAGGSFRHSDAGDFAIAHRWLPASAVDPECGLRLVLVRKEGAR